MAEFFLPAQFQDYAKTGVYTKRRPDAKNVRVFKIYRFDP